MNKQYPNGMTDEQRASKRTRQAAYHPVCMHFDHRPGEEKLRDPKIIARSTDVPA